MEIRIWTPGLRTRGHKPGQHEGGHSEPQGDKVTEVCSGAAGGGWGGGLVLRGQLVQPVTPLLRFPSQCQGLGIDV